ncbi:hypothetical protein H112_07766 [Trichophyton rubrum D6]|uniref:Uncharacterized protein n=3 Tax=Trichophyton TaxID=5550 RepID=A0A080WJU4_TRIRC|nr:uncharacterized protein TERG_11551 [Trichophyton rubrum CBS 118892]EZF11046.1 hypothetical protein H100_07790 [Trichophyton rubrum MR850]EZF37920.1 hypothetical protein H102_07754 [Trichophyton rubrum CBS 100081]EZF48556.1 hypothetical protein H103_07779 [Trichophyton rubrum CBS 288.86]EZF59197.1 hypothetical protein H104_07727 [Trichophyton rubrum CBS 289.86]EZF69785.1 hypothetical protein H105_07780 [Trichophyton soudanense CBS 452.61]EZF80585.1 hypothetical protein H110_07776 [Trichophy
MTRKTSTSRARARRASASANARRRISLKSTCASLRSRDVVVTPPVAVAVVVTVAAIAVVAAVADVVISVVAVETVAELLAADLPTLPALPSTRRTSLLLEANKRADLYSSMCMDWLPKKGDRAGLTPRLLLN